MMPSCSRDSEAAEPQENCNSYSAEDFSSTNEFEQLVNDLLDAEEKMT